MDVYCNVFTTVMNGEEYKRRSHFYIAEQPTYNESEELIVTWKSLDSFYETARDVLPFSIWKRKNGRILVMDGEDFLFNNIEEKKNPDFFLVFTRESIKAKVSIQDILDYRDSELAIQYLIERGLTWINH